jgi:hypothetical protein
LWSVTSCVIIIIIIIGGFFALKVSGLGFLVQKYFTTLELELFCETFLPEHLSGFFHIDD